MKIRRIFCRAMVVLVALLVWCGPGEAGQTTPDVQRLEAREWNLVELNGAPVAASAGEKRPRVKLDPLTKQATGYSGCNNFFANYQLDGDKLNFGPVGATRRACPDLETGLETAFMVMLERTVTWEIRDGVLLLSDDSRILGRFAKAPGTEAAEGSLETEPEITGTVWHWVRTIYNDDRKIIPQKPENYTVEFHKDGRLSVRADCNQKGGSYSRGGTRLSMEITHSTMAACGEDSLEGDFVRGLTAGGTFFFRDSALYIDLPYDTGTMKFSRSKDKP